MKRLWMILFLLFIWGGFSNDFSAANLLLGLLVSIFCHFLIIRKSPENRLNILRLFSLLVYTFIELIKSSLIVAWDIVTPKQKSLSKIISIPLDCENDIERTLLANIISLTPGTISIDLDSDNNHLILHAMFAQDVEKIIDYVKKKVEPKVLRVFRHV